LPFILKDKKIKNFLNFLNIKKGIKKLRQLFVERSFFIPFYLPNKNIRRGKLKKAAFTML